MAKHLIFSDSISIDIIKNNELDNWILKNLEHYKKNNQSVTVSNVGGFQSPEINDPQILKILGNHIVESMKDFTEKNMTYRLMNLWINENYKFCYNDYHVHSGSDFSGVYYVKTPKNSGNLVFHRTSSINYTSLNNFFSNEDTNQLFYVEPKKGMLVIFPSLLAHSVRPNLSDDSRVSISFNFNIED